jgi:hypothetical protein
VFISKRAIPDFLTDSMSCCSVDPSQRSPDLKESAEEIEGIYRAHKATAFLQEQTLFLHQKPLGTLQFFCLQNSRLSKLPELLFDVPCSEEFLNDIKQLNRLIIRINPAPDGKTKGPLQPRNETPWSLVYRDPIVHFIPHPQSGITNIQYHPSIHLWLYPSAVSSESEGEKKVTPPLFPEVLDQVTLTFSSSIFAFPQPETEPPLLVPSTGLRHRRPTQSERELPASSLIFSGV